MEGKRFIGLTIERDYLKRTLSISMPGYTAMALNRFNAQDISPTHSPMLYLPPTYGKKGKPQLATNPSTNYLNNKNLTLKIQQITGTLLYFARAVDPTLLVAINKVSLEQSNPTPSTERAAMRLLQYIKAYPNPIITYHPSDMVLIIHSDATFASETRSRSRVAGYGYLGNKDNNDKLVNGHIYAMTKVLPNVVSSAGEAEYGGIYHNAKEAETLRQTLEDLGYPQPPTNIISDNKCAVGISKQEMKQKRSKAFDVQFHWIRDRVSQRHFDIVWEPGITNLADLLTKAHTVKHHKQVRLLYINDTTHPLTNEESHNKNVIISSTSSHDKQLRGS